MRRLPDRHGTLRRLRVWLRAQVVEGRTWWLRKICKMDIGEDVHIAPTAKLDLTNPRGVHIGSGTLLAFGSVVLSHDMSRALHTDTHIGRNCFIGAHALIMPGIRVGDSCIVGAGSVVTRDVPPNSIAVGNPARVLRSGIVTRRWGVLEEAYQQALAETGVEVETDSEAM